MSKNEKKKTTTKNNDNPFAKQSKTPWKELQKNQWITIPLAQLKTSGFIY
jgi:hypothetical protein